MRASVDGVEGAGGKMVRDEVREVSGQEHIGLCRYDKEFGFY